MGFTAGAGQIVVTDAAGTRTVFDSDEALFSAQFYSGQVSIGQRVATYVGSTSTENAVNVSVDHAITTVPSGYDTVTGGFKVTTATAQGLHGYGWFNAGGTYVHVQAPVSTQARAGTGENWAMSSMATYTFMVSGTSLILRERTILRPQSTLGGETWTTTLYAVTFDYKLFVGKFI